MRITSVVTNLFQPKFSVPTNLNNRSAQNNNLTYPNDVFVKNNCQNFEGAKLQKSTFRNVAANAHLGCVYCGRHMFTNKEKDILSKSLKDVPAKAFTTIMGDFLSYFDDMGITLLNKLDEVATNYPQAKLREVLQVVTPGAEDRLVNRQKEIFKEILDLKTLLPEQQQKELKTLIDASISSVDGEPFLMEFSGKEYSYRIKRLASTMNNTKDAEFMTNMASILSHPIFKTDTPLTPKIIAQVAKLTKTPRLNIRPTTENAKEKIQLHIINKIKQIGERDKNTNIVNLCNISMQRIANIPVNSNFSNKAFIYKLQNILEGNVNQATIEVFANVYKKLPKSSNSIDAFVIKNKTATNQAIINNFLDSYTVTIEHIIPSSKGGENNIKNWALACKKCNGQHGSEDIKTDYPFSRTAPQKYFNTIIQDCNENDLFTPDEVKGMAKNFETTTGIKINLSELKE